MKTTVITLVLLLCAFCFSAHAKALNSEIADYEVEQLASLLEVDKTDISVEILYDLNENPSFLLADISPQGYAIVFREASKISEMSTEGEPGSPYGSALGKKYYAGPMCYIVKNDDTYTDVLTGKALSNADIVRARSATEQALEKLHQMQGDEVK